MQPRYYQQEQAKDERRAKEEREYLLSNRPRDPYAGSQNPPPPAQGSQPLRPNGPPGAPPPSRNNGYQGPPPTRQDSTSSMSAKQRSRSRGRSPGRHQQPSIPPTPFRRPSNDFQSGGSYSSRPDLGAGNQQSIHKSNARSWEPPMPGPPKMTGSGIQGAPGGPTTLGTRYRNPFEKMAASASAAPIPPPQASPTYPGPPPGAYTGGRAPNSMGYRGSPTAGRDTPSSLSSASEGDRSRAPMARKRSLSRGEPFGSQSYPTDRDRDRAAPAESAGPPRERGRSKSVARRSKSKSRPSSHSRARSRARSRPRSRSRQRSKSRHRSLSRPARQDIAMGEYERTFRSPSRSKRGRYDYSDSSSGYSDSDSDGYRRSKNRKKRRYHSLSEGSSSYLDDSDDSDDSVTEVDVNGCQTGSEGFTPAERLNGPMTDMLEQLKRLNNRYSEREEKQRQTQRKIRWLTKKLDSEMRGLQRDFNRSSEEQPGDSRSVAVPSTQPTQPTQHTQPRVSKGSTPQPTPPLAPPGQSPQQTGPATADLSSTQLPSSTRSRASTWNGGAMRNLAPTESQEPMKPPPSLMPASAGTAVKAEGDLEVSLASIKRRRRVTSDGAMFSSSSAGVGVLDTQTTFAPPPTGPNYATASTRSTGFRRVFDRATYDLPIANQRELSVISLGRSTAAQRIGGRGPRPLTLNPFARGTPFENIAAVNSLDGMIIFYDINRGERVMEITPKESRVIPYAETLAWVTEDTLVAVSHLKSGADWKRSKEAMDKAKAAGNGIPNGDPDRFSLPETQTNLISIYFGRDGNLRNTIITLQGYPHDKPIQTVSAVAGEPNLMGYITAGNDKQLIHWRFTRRDSGGFTAGGMAGIHSLHSNTILSTMYSHTSKRLHSGGLDGRYVVYDMVHRGAVCNEKMGKIVHIIQNPADPRIQAVVFSSDSKESSKMSKKPHQYQLLDDRVPGQKVLALDHKNPTNVSKFTTPSWHTEGGLFCSGTDDDGIVNIWDVRWAGMRLDDASRPGAVGVVSADLTESGIQAARAEAEANGMDGAYFDLQHPIFWSTNQRQRVQSRSSLHRLGGPSQVVKVGGNKVAQALFHPTRNVVMVQNFDGSLTFTDYNMISKAVV
ncbi:hypothetical protein BGX24_009636 [Mortierella sp. AD032]|nr:hypothetical protein BGX24_009636 [Mortierella sp. AD032]